MDQRQNEVRLMLSPDIVQELLDKNPDAAVQITDRIINSTADRMVKSKENMNDNKEAANQDLTATQKRVRVLNREFDSRIKLVNQDHSNLLSRYSHLIHYNDYFTRLADRLITITELAGALQYQDEKDKDSISLLGAKGFTNVQQ